jgi:hypothetical protein
MRLLLILAAAGLLCACTDLGDAPVSERNTFIRFYASDMNYEARMALPESDGYVLLGNTRHDNNARQDMVIMKTDLTGSRLWETRIDNARANHLLPVAEGYILTGESIQLNPTRPEVVEQVNTNLLLVRIDRNGTETARYAAPALPYIRGADTLTIDTYGLAATPAGNGVTALGAYAIPTGLQRSIKINFSGSLIPTEDPVFYDLQAFNYQNVRSLFSTGSHFIWASTAMPQSANEFAFTAITNVPAGSGAQAVFTTIGENETDRQHVTGDMQRIAVGFGVVGTYSERGTIDDPIGGSANIFVARLNAAGALTGPPIYLDGDELFNGVGALANPRISSSQDTGDAICATRDGGFVIAGTYVTTPTRGNGQRDLLIAKLDAFGNVRWARLYGGSGSELAGSIHETDDRHLLVAGTVVSPTGDVRVMFMARFDANGELRN